jgi:putative membrane protein
LVKIKDITHVKTQITLAASLFLGSITMAMAATPLSVQDKAFIRQAAIGGMAEVQAGKMAVAKGGSTSVKEFGQHMIDDHVPNNQALMTLAQQKGAAVPASLDHAHEKQVTMLQKETGRSFDKAYIHGQIIGHEQMAQVMAVELKSGADPDLKAFAQKTLPVVEEHLKMARQLKD